MTRPAAPRRHCYGCCFVATIHIHVSHSLSLLLTPVTPLPCLFCRHRRCHSIGFSSLHGVAASQRTAYHADPPRCSTTWCCSVSVVVVRVWLWVVLLSGVLWSLNRRLPRRLPPPLKLLFWDKGNFSPDFSHL